MRDPKGEHKCKLVKHDGSEDQLELRYHDALEYAKAAAAAFGVGEDRAGNQAVPFDAAIARAALKESKEEKKARGRSAKKGGQP